MDRYGDGLEADFQEIYHLNLGELLRQWQFRRVLNLIHQLPQACRFHAAVANDEEHVELILAAQEGQPDKKSGPPLAEWGSQNEQLASIYDALMSLVAITVKANGGNPGKTSPYMRPPTAFDDVRQEMRERSHRKVLSRVRIANGKVE